MAKSWDSYEGELEDLALPEIDEALLMELLEEGESHETQSEEAERLRCVIRSLEPDILPDGGVTVDDHGHDCEECGLDDILSDLDSRDCSPQSTSFFFADEFQWMEIEVAPESPASEMSDWYMDENGVVMYHEDARDYSSFYYGDSSMDQVYSPLWQ